MNDELTRKADDIANDINAWQGSNEPVTGATIRALAWTFAMNDELFYEFETFVHNVEDLDLDTPDAIERMAQLVEAVNSWQGFDNPVTDELLAALGWTFFTDEALFDVFTDLIEDSMDDDED